MATTQEWIDELKSISVLELAERIKALEEEFVDDAPGAVKEGLDKAEAEKLKGELEEAGATVTLK
jgi:ribosomal protein L7/L12